MASLAIKASARQTKGKGAARKMRVAGKTPAIMYGSKIAPQSLELDARAMERLIEQGALGRLVSLDLGDETRAVIVKDYHRHPVIGTILHVDFHAVALDEVLQTTVAVIIVGEEAREQDEGVLVHGTRELVVECLPTNIPEYLQADVSQLSVGDALRAEDIEMPSGVALISEEDTVIASIVIPTEIVEEEETEETDEMLEPELIGEDEDADDGAESADEDSE